MISVIGVNLGDLNVAWQRSFQEQNKQSSGEGNGVLALSAFMLSTIQTPLARKTLVKEMWDSGADTIVRYLIRPSKSDADFRPLGST